MPKVKEAKKPSGKALPEDERWVEPEMGGLTFDQEYAVVPIDSIEPHPDNPNAGDVGVIEESIEENGWYGAVTVQKSRMRILAGEHRWRAARAKGADHIPVILRDVDDVIALKILLVDNESARHGVVDLDRAGALLDSLDNIRGTGFSFERLEEYERQQEQEEAHREEQELQKEKEKQDEEPLPIPEDDRYENQYGVIVVVEDEPAQREAYQKLKELGYECRVVTV